MTNDMLTEEQIVKNAEMQRASEDQKARANHFVNFRRNYGKGSKQTKSKKKLLRK